MCEREDKKRKREEQKKEKKIERTENQDRLHRDSSEEENEEPILNSTSEMELNIDINKCFRCEVRYEGINKNWINCCRCPRWLHGVCVTSVNLLSG